MPNAILRRLKKSGGQGKNNSTLNYIYLYYQDLESSQGPTVVTFQMCKFSTVYFFFHLNNYILP